MPVRLFYSYSHRDSQHRERMETILATLRRSGLLQSWHDARILPGTSISAALEAGLEEADIVAFLFSPDFLASSECMKEWERAKTLAANGRGLFRVPIILRSCAWKDYLGDDDVKALPDDGHAIMTSSDIDAAWMEVYEGIASVIETIRTTFTPKQEFLAHLRDTELPLGAPLALDDIFVFPHLTKRGRADAADAVTQHIVPNVSELLEEGHVLIDGDHKSGKTGLAKHLAQSLVNSGQPVMFADLGSGGGHLGDKYLPKLYCEQFDGDYTLWQKRENKTLVVDNLTESPKQLEFVTACCDRFDRVIALVSSDVFHAYLRDDTRYAQFQHLRIEPLTLVKQEELIRSRLRRMENKDALTDGFVDHVEDRVNSIILSNRIVPRYPFFVLSILQTFEAVMPRSLTITSYGHCYFVFILSSLSRGGIADSDDALNSAFNFLEQLALAKFLARRESPRECFDYDGFTRKYRDEYLIEDSLLNRLTHKDYGIITPDGGFKTSYMYYFFLGKLLATTPDLSAQYLADLCDHSYDEGNYLTLLFAIHHATDDALIEDILVRTMVELEAIESATLSKRDTTRFTKLISELPQSVLSRDSVEEQRARARRERDNDDATRSPDGDSDGDDASPDSVLRVIRNNKILGQVLRTQYGKLPRHRIEDIVETIADSAFRLISLLLHDEDELHCIALHLQAQYPDADLEKLKEFVTAFSFLWAIINIELAVHAISVPNISEAVEAVVARNSTPAYDLLGYFCMLDVARALSARERDVLRALYNTHGDMFIRRVVSIRTQDYMNTHRSHPSIEQSICSILKIRYRARLRAIDRRHAR